MNAEKESYPKKAVQKRKQAEAAPLAVHETEYANGQRQDQSANKNQSSGESTAISGNAAIPAVHSPNSAYSSGSEQMHKQLQESMEKTGDPSHPETQEKEKEYRSTLSIKELRDYQDTKSANAIDKNTAEKTVVIPDAKAPADAASPKPVNVLDAKEKPGAVGVAQDAAINAEPQAAEVKSPTALENPGFIALQGQINTTAKEQQKHDPASKSSKDAQAAAPSPSNERESMAQAGQVNKMSTQEPGLFSASAFKAELKKKIEGMKLPKNEEEADNFDKNNNIKEVNDRAMGDVKQEKNAASGSIANTTKEKPNTAGQPVRNVAKMPLPNHGKAPAVANVSKAMPSKRDAAGIEAPIKAQTASIDEQMSANGVTDNMLANSNEPTFKAALGEKNKAKEQSEASTTQFRVNETKQLGQTQNEAQAQATKQIAGMHGARKGGMDKVHGNQNQTAAKDTEKRKEIANKINGIYKGAKSDVDNILSSLDSTVAYKFAVGSKAAKVAFEKHVEDNMEAYKRRRYRETNKKYGALAVAGQWLWDKAAGLPEEVNKYFKSGKDEYIRVMDIYITDIANHVAGQLNAAKRRIATGKKDVQSYVDSLSPSLKKLGAAAISEIQGKFNALEKDVDSKKDALIDVLAKKYSENIASIDARIKELKEQNKGLVGKVMNAMTGIFAFIIEMKNTLMNLLAKVAEVIGAIIMDPIGFFSNMIAGVGQGFSNFTTNIWTHLKTGFFTWLTGASKGITLTMPEDIFSLKGIFSITMQVLGLGWDGIRAIGATVVGEPLMKALETGVEIVQVIRKDGIAGLWEYLKDQFQDLKATVMDAIMDIIQSQVIQAGIKWILGLLSPVGAFVKAIMAIVDVVKFFIQRAAQIAELISAFMDSVAAIASGKVGAVAKAIENALAKAVPVLIGLLASILGISGLADKVLGVIRKIRQRITAGITKFWNFVKEKGKALLGKVGIGKKDKKEKEKKSVVDDSDDLHWSAGVDHFKSKDGGNHEMFYKEKGKDFQLYVASENPQPITETLGERKQISEEAKDIPEQSTISQAQQYYNQNILPLEKELEVLEKKDSKSSNNDKNANIINQKTKALRKARKGMVDLFEKIRLNGSDRDEIPTVVKPMGKGHVIANPLTWLEGNMVGSEPGSANPPGWEFAKQLRTHSTDKDWVRGHLLSEKLHGPGENWNLVPIRSVVNTQMETYIESKAKTAIKDKTAILSYEIEVKEWWSGEHESMQHFPRRWEVTLVYLKYDAGKLINNSDPIRANFNQGKIPMLGENPALNINDIGGPTIKQMEPKLADVFVYIDIPAVKNDKKGTIISWDNLFERIEKAVNKKGVNREYDLIKNINILRESSKIKI